MPHHTITSQLQVLFCLTGTTTVFPQVSFLLLRDKVKRPIKETTAACLRLERCPWGPKECACLNEQAESTPHGQLHSLSGSLPLMPYGTE